MLINIKKQNIKVSVEDNINKLLIVCSHERSGTHYLMNSISHNSIYTSKSFLNFDYMPLGDIVNFYNKVSIGDFFKKFSNLNMNGKNYCLSSIVKSHHSPHYFDNLFNDSKINFLYIYRNPIDTLISFWRFMHRWSWHEGPKVDDPFTFVRSKPDGQMTRYQKTSYHTIFDRWANHLTDWYTASQKNSNIFLINYRLLNEDFDNTMSSIFRLLKINNNKKLLHPPKDYIKGKDIKFSDKNYSDLNKYINDNMLNYHIIEKNIKF